MKTILINTSEIFIAKTVKVISEASMDGSYTGIILGSDPKQGILVEQECGSNSFVSPKECILVLEFGN